MALTEAQKTQIQRLYEAIAKPLQARYGKSAVLEGLRLHTDQDGNVTDVEVSINLETPPDPDGDTTRVRKDVSIW